MSNTKIQSSVLGASGEHLVLSMLLRKGFIAGKTPDFTKDYDIIVVNKDGNDSAPIQVKTTVHNHWIMSYKNEKPIKNLFFCLVKMDLENDKSEIYVVDSNKISKALKTSHSLWLKLPGLKGQKHNDSTMRKLQRDYSNFAKESFDKFLNNQDRDFINEYQYGWLDKYRNAWHIIKT